MRLPQQRIGSTTPEPGTGVGVKIPNVTSGTKRFTSWQRARNERLDQIGKRLEEIYNRMGEGKACYNDYLEAKQLTQEKLQLEAQIKQELKDAEPKFGLSG